MTTPINDSVLHKIQALLRMAEHPGSNEHEAAIAIEKVQALLLEHNLSRASINTGPEPGPAQQETIGKVEVVSDSGHTWKKGLLSVIARASLCRVITENRAHSAHLFGSRTNVLAVLSMYEWTVEQLETMALRQWKTYKASGGSETARTWKPAFYYGATLILRDRLQNPFTTFAATTGRAIVLVNKAQVDAAVKRVFPETTRSYGRANSGSDGYGAGKRAGTEIRLGRNAALGAGRLALGSGR